jgi:GNAT superfamily N-acetyltransferase
MLGTLAFLNTYQEELTLTGSRRLRLRIIQPTDKQKLADGFQRLSTESRFRRFFNYKRTLTPDELHYFTEFDGLDHLAIGAFELNEAGIEGAVVGVARFIRSPDRVDRAEFALVVSDDHQGLGLGRLLLEHLLAAAAERGITGFQGYLLAENTRMQRLINRVCKDALFSRDAEMLSVACPVPQQDAVMPAAARAGIRWGGLPGFLAAGFILALSRFWASVWHSVLAGYEVGLALLSPAPLSAGIEVILSPAPG